MWKTAYPQTQKQKQTEAELAKSEKKTLKFQMMMSPEEAEVLDDWMFKNRVRSRAEAIRRLCQIGLRAERALPTMVRDVAEVLDLANEAIDVPEEILAQIEVDDLPSAEIDKKIAQRLYDVVNFTFNRQIEAQDNLFHLLVEINPLVSNPQLAEAIKQADDQADDEVPNEAVLQSIGASRHVQLKYWRKRREGFRQQREANQAKSDEPSHE